jgi:hypothetical protein
MVEVRQIPLVNILIDVENPRIPQPSMGQREAIRGIATEDEQAPRKLVALARHIVQNGLSPTEHMWVMPFQGKEERFVVLEGNRRFAALKGLENPDLFDGVISSSLLAALRRLNKQYIEAPVEDVSCVVFESREEADPWIQLKHDGELSGAGTVTWGSDEKSRYWARMRGVKHVPLDIQTQALNFLENHGDLTAVERRKVPPTSFKRLLETLVFREKMGVELDGGRLAALTDEDSVARALLYTAKALISKKIRTKDIYLIGDRIKVANELPNSIVVASTRKSGEGILLDTGMPTPKAKRQAGKKAKPRDRLIPHDCALSIGETRLADIERELQKRLGLEGTPNAVSVLFRVFVELSCDAYIIRTKLTAATEEDPLGKKLRTVLEDLIGKDKLTKKQAQPVRRACQKDSFLCPSVTMMHQYIHNVNMAPSPTDLRSYWDSLQPFMIAIWAP